MSVFRPMNSDESNLFTIRLTCAGAVASTDAGTAIKGDDNDTVAYASNVSSVSDGAGTGNYLISPSSNNLPAGFKLAFLDASRGIMQLTYGKAFTSQPSVLVQCQHNLGAAFASASSAISCNVKHISSTQSNLYFYTESSGAGLNLVGDTALIGFDLIISGPVKVGLTTGNSNKGWQLEGGSSPSDVYTYMNVGIGDSNPTSNLSVDVENTTVDAAHITANKLTTASALKISSSASAAAASCLELDGSSLNDAIKIARGTAVTSGSLTMVSGALTESTLVTGKSANSATLRTFTTCNAGTYNISNAGIVYANGGTASSKGSGTSIQVTVNASKVVTNVTATSPGSDFQLGNILTVTLPTAANANTTLTITLLANDFATSSGGGINIDTNGDILIDTYGSIKIGTQNDHLVGDSSKAGQGFQLGKEGSTVYVKGDLKVEGTTTNTIEVSTVTSGSAQFNNTVTVGSDASSHDVLFYGSTKDSRLLWDNSEDSLDVINSSLTFGGQTGKNQIKVTENLADALNIVQRTGGLSTTADALLTSITTNTTAIATGSQAGLATVSTSQGLLSTTPNALLLSITQNVTSANNTGENPLTGVATTTNGSGYGAVLTLVISGNVVTGVTVETGSQGKGYAIGDKLFVAKSNITGSTTDLIFTLVADNIVPAGSGATITLVASGTTAVTGCTVVNAGSGYAPGDTLTVQAANISGSASDLVFTLKDDNIVNTSYLKCVSSDSDQLVQIATKLDLGPGESYKVQHTADAANEDLFISQLGAFDSSLVLGSAGITADAIAVKTLGSLVTTANALLISVTQYPTDANATAFTGLATTSSGVGKGATISFTVQTVNNVNVISTLTAATAGSGYAPGDTVTVSKSLIAGTSSGKASADLVITLNASDVTGLTGGLDVNIGSGGIDFNSSGVFNVEASSNMNIKHQGPLATGQDIGVGNFSSNPINAANNGTLSIAAANVSTNGKGHDAVLSLNVTGNTVTTVRATTAGVGYAVGDTITVLAANIPNTSSPAGASDANFVFTLQYGDVNATGGLNVDIGSGGIDMETSGALSIDSAGGASNITHTSTVNGDFSLAQDGRVDASLVLASAGTASDAMKVQLLGPLVTTENALLSSVTTGRLASAITDASAGNLSGLATTSSGLGKGAVFSCTIDANKLVTAIQATTAGSGYAPGDTVTVDKSLIAGSNNNKASANLVVTLKPSDINATGGLDIDVGTGGVDLKSSGQVSLFTSNTGSGSFSVKNTGAINTTADALKESITTNTSGATAMANLGRAVTADKISTNGFGTGVSLTMTIDAPDGKITAITAAGGSGYKVGDTLTFTPDGGSEAVITLKHDDIVTSGGLDVDIGSGGIDMETTGALSIKSAGDASSITHTSTANNDFSLVQDGTIDASLALSSAGSAADSVKVKTLGTIKTTAGTLLSSVTTHPTTSGSNLATTSSGVGKGAVFTFTVTNNVVTAITSTAGSGYAIGDTVTATISGSGPLVVTLRPNDITMTGGIDIDSGSGGFDVQTTGALSLKSENTGTSGIKVKTTGPLVTSSLLNSITQNTTNGAGTGTSITADKISTSGSGSGAAFTIAITDNAVSAIAASAPGNGYAAGDTLTFAAGSNVVVTLQPQDINTTGGLDIDSGSGGVNVGTSGQLSLHTSNTDAKSIEVKNSGRGALVTTANALVASITSNPSDAANTTLTITSANVTADANSKGTGAVLTLVITGNTVTGITASGTMSGYAAGDTLTVLASQIQTPDTSGQPGGAAPGNSNSNLVITLRRSDINLAGGLDIDVGTGGIKATTGGNLNLTNAGTLDITSTGAATLSTRGALTLDSDGTFSLKVADGNELTLGNDDLDAYFKVAANGTAGDEDVRIRNSKGTDEASIEIQSNDGGIKMQFDCNKNFVIQNADLNDDADTDSLTNSTGSGNTFVGGTRSHLTFDGNATAGSRSIELYNGQGTGVDAIKINANAGGVEINAADNKLVTIQGGGVDPGVSTGEGVSIGGDSGKVGFFDAPPLVARATTISATGTAANTSTFGSDTLIAATTTYSGYTFYQVVQALIDFGLLSGGTANTA